MIGIILQPSFGLVELWHSFGSSGILLALQFGCGAVQYVLNTWKLGQNYPYSYMYLHSIVVLHGNIMNIYSLGPIRLVA